MNYKPSIYNNWFKFDNNNFLYNSHTGYFGIIDDEMYEKINNIANELDIEKNYDILIKKGIVVNSEIDEDAQAKIKENEEKYGKFPSKMAFTIATTRNCNYRCKYCFEGKENCFISMDKTTQDNTIQFIKNMVQNNKNCNGIHITWFGGEPLLNRECIENISKDIIAYCDKNNLFYTASIITNASLIDESFSKSFNELRIKTIQITFDGNEEKYCEYKGTTKQNFQKAINAIFLIPKDVKINIRLNTDYENYDSIKSFVSQLSQKIKENNVTFYLANIDNEDTKDMFSEKFVSYNKDFLEFLYKNKLYNSIKSMLPQPRYISCPAIKSGNYAIDADGSLKKCEHYIGNDDKICRKC